jgi:hypothetical protein
MFFGSFTAISPRARLVVPYRVVLAALAMAVTAANCAGREKSVASKEKHIIGATAIVTEASSGLSFPARVDTGASSCSLHVERIIIKDKTSKRVHNIGKRVRFEVKDGKGKLHWIEGEVADAVRVKSSSLKSGDYDHRYKVKLLLQCDGVSKEVLVTLNNRTDMEFPMLLGRNFLRGDFLVDVERDDKDSGSDE